MRRSDLKESVFWLDGVCRILSSELLRQRGKLNMLKERTIVLNNGSLYN